MVETLGIIKLSHGEIVYKFIFNISIIIWKYDIMTMWKEVIIMSLIKINPRGQITIPTKFRSALHCKPGDYVEVKMEQILFGRLALLKV